MSVLNETNRGWEVFTLLNVDNNVIVLREERSDRSGIHCLVTTMEDSAHFHVGGNDDGSLKAILEVKENIKDKRIRTERHYCSESLANQQH